MGVNFMQRIRVNDCFTRFPEEWVCRHVEEEIPGHVVSGRLIAHSRDADEVVRAELDYRRALGEVPTYIRR